MLAEGIQKRRRCGRVWEDFTGEVEFGMVLQGWGLYHRSFHLNSLLPPRRERVDSIIHYYSVHYYQVGQKFIQDATENPNELFGQPNIFLSPGEDAYLPGWVRLLPPSVELPFYAGSAHS